MNKNPIATCQKVVGWPIFEDRMGTLLNGLIDDLWVGNQTRTSELSRFNPQINIEEQPDAYLVTAEVPGLDESDLEVSCERKKLIISGHKKEDYQNTENGIRYTGRSYGSFSKAIPFSVEIDKSQISAKLEKGILRITLPKSKESLEQTKKISIQVN